MTEFTMIYDGPSVLIGGVNIMARFAPELHKYMEQNFEEHIPIERVKIEGRGPGSRLVKITFPDGGDITRSRIEVHDDFEEVRLVQEIQSLYEKFGFSKV